jgi:NAD(P)H dehydrogenase (quinone)
MGHITMSKVLVTGASGQIGRRTLQQLRKRMPTGELVGLARDPADATDLTATGIEIRPGDYFDHESLLRAFKGIEKLLLVSSHAFTDRNTQHYNVITAAREAGVEHVAYTPIIRKADSGFTMHEITPADIFTEQTLKASGLTYTIVAQPPFLESLVGYVGGENADQTGVRVPAGSGKVAPATRDDLAEAQAVILSESGHENQTYALYGDPAVSFADIAQILSDIRGTTVPYMPVTDDEFVKHFAANFPAAMTQPLAAFFLAWMHGINNGEWDGPTGDLERLIGRKPTTTATFLARQLAPALTD